MPQIARVSKAALALALLTLSLGSAHAASVFDLRALNAYRNFTGDPETAAQQINDLFNNGNLLTGPTYSGGLTTPSALYTVIGSTAPAETTPGDLTLPNGTPVGRVQFVQSGATPTTTIVVNGVASLDNSYRLRLNSPTEGPFFNNSLSNFMGEAAFGFVTPDAGARYGVRFTDDVSGGAFGGVSFNDRITLDVVRMSSGEAGVQLRRVSGDGAGNLTTSNVETRAVSSFLTGASTLADVDFINLRLLWIPNLDGVTRMVGRVELLGATNGVVTALVGDGVFGTNTLGIFRGESTTSFLAGASWTPTAVPETSTWALMLAGAAALSAAMARRRSA